ncbi:hypothetical protein ABK040_016064 [Willaertia magna]
MSLSRWFQDPFFDEPFFGTQRGGGTNLAPYGRQQGLFDTSLQQFRPQTDVSETDKEIRVVANTPGLRKEDIRIDVDDQNRLLTFSGETKREDKRDDETHHLIERSYGRFTRSIRLPKNTDFDNIKANMDNGVLKIIVPKKEQQIKTKSINVE